MHFIQNKTILWLFIACIEIKGLNSVVEITLKTVGSSLYAFTPS